jgi:DNA polymerase I
LPEAILDYCQADVEALARLLPVMLPRIDLPRALLRRRYMTAASAIERYGVPIDIEMLQGLRQHWDLMHQGELITAIDAGYGVYEGRTFKQARFADWLAAQRIPWL